MIASRRGEGRGNQVMSKTSYVEIASCLVMVARSCYFEIDQRKYCKHQMDSKNNTLGPESQESQENNRIIT
jgi:hypothetical protein